MGEVNGGFLLISSVTFRRTKPEVETRCGSAKQGFEPPQFFKIFFILTPPLSAHVALILDSLCS